jgi:CRISPR/Cas system-associated exonuclease Cas4 (RecB family)
MSTFILGGAFLLVVIIGLALFRRWRLHPRLNFYYRGSRARRVRQQLVSRNNGVTGKPDYIIRHDGHPIPVLRKSGAAPDYPYDSHIAQVLIHCLLIEETYNQVSPYGIIRYDDRTFEIDYDETAFNALLDLIDEIRLMRAEYDDQPLHRSHEEERRCVACRHHEICEESLA